MTDNLDRDGARSNPFRPDPEKCCIRCAFGSGEHSEFCLEFVPMQHWRNDGWEAWPVEPTGPRLAPGQSLEEFCDLYQKFA